MSFIDRYWAHTDAHHILGLIYRQHRPVHYSPSSRSALAEAELEYKDKHRSHAIYAAFDVDLARQSEFSPSLLSHISGRSDLRLLIFTTTPWTMSANMVTLRIYGSNPGAYQYDI